MFRKTVATAIAATVFAGAALTTTGAFAGSHHHHHHGGGGLAIAGVVGALLGASAAASQSQPYVRSYERECFDEPITRWDRYYGTRVIVGYRTICR